MKSLHHESNLQIVHLLNPNILYCNWTGPQTLEGIKQSGAIILDLQAQYDFRKILHDNTQVVGAWHLAARWTAEEWFPAMVNAGMQHFAWVLSPNVFAETSAKRALPAGDFVTTFKSYDEAFAWLTDKP
jgi:hypothetical protein